MAKENLYHLLHHMPAVEAWEMPPGLERAARQLAVSGRLRISADHARNFVRHGTSDWDATFTARELTDPVLIERTRGLLAKHVPAALGPQGVDDLLTRLRADLVKARGISVEKELRVARVVVQSAYPSVVQLLLESGTEMFVSYAHNVAELMAVHDWQTHGTASGMQATMDTGTQVFISCGGDPFFEGEHKTYTTDGFPALARMMVIGGQEIGHFSDLVRQRGQIIGRYSLTETALAGRRADMARVQQLRGLHAKAGLQALFRAEQGLAFYDKRLKCTPPWFYWQLRRGLAYARYRALAGAIHMKLKSIPQQRYAHAMLRFLDDMAFNLSPQAEVYRHADAREEERIACIEAVARVPQQILKWGHTPVMVAWPNLTTLYEGTIIPACEQAIRQPAPSIKIPLIQKLKIILTRHMHKRPDYYPERKAALR